GLERGGVAWPRPAVPADRRAVRAARGGAADLPADVVRRRRAVPGQALHPRTDAERPATAAPAADPDRRWRRTQDAAPGGQVRAGLQPVRLARTAAQARGTARALRTRGPRLRRDREDRDDRA